MLLILGERGEVVATAMLFITEVTVSLWASLATSDVRVVLASEVSKRIYLEKEVGPDI